MCSGNVCSKMMVFRKRLQAVRICTLNIGHSTDIHRVLRQALPSIVSLLCVSTRAPSSVAQSKIALSNPLLNTQRGDQDQVGENESGLGDESPVDKIYCKSCIRMAATIDNDSGKRLRSNAKI